MTRSRRARPLAAAALAVAVAVGLAVALLTGGDDEPAASADGRLVWAGRPQVLRPPELPRDRLMSGRLRNDSLRAVRLDADRARLVDARGREVPSTVRFSGTFAHGLYSPRYTPREGKPDFERRRLGELAVVRAGETVPLTVSWRLRRGAEPPVRLEVGTVRIALPEAARGAPARG